MNSTSSGSKNSSHDVVIVGAGIVGLTIAAYLQREGHKVTLIDRKGIANEASFGNAGGIAISDILPMASPRMLHKAPKWLLDPLGPLSIRPEYLPKILPWLFRFWRASWKDQYDTSIVSQVAMMQLAGKEFNSFIHKTPNLLSFVRNDGALHVYESQAELDAERKFWELRQQHGIEVVYLRKDEIADYQPGFTDEISAGAFVPQWQCVNNPHQYANTVWQHVAQNGATLIESEVKRLQPSDGGTTITLADGRELNADRLIIAAGAWSHKLTAQLGDTIPLETERGYNTTLPAGALDLKRHVVFESHGFLLTPLADGIRVGGAVEFAGLDAAPNYKRSELMLAKAKRFLPELKTENGVQWMGFRPSLPDTRPVIGRATKANNVFYAFGHGHLGLTQSTPTARLVSDLIAQRTPSIDLQNFRPDRF